MATQACALLLAAALALALALAVQQIMAPTGARAGQQQRQRQRATAAAGAAAPARLAQPGNAHRTVHFMYLGLWGSPDLPPAFAANLRAFRERNLGREVRLWGGAEVDTLVRGRLTREQARLYDAAAPIQRADLARYLVVLEHGGWYFDLDVGVGCKAGHHLDQQAPHARGRPGERPDSVTAACTNAVDALEESAGLGASGARSRGVGGVGGAAAPTGAFFWESQPLSRDDQLRSLQRKCRGGQSAPLG